MRAKLWLSGAIIAEVSATLSLRQSTQHPSWIVTVVVGYTVAFACLGMTLRSGMALGVAYGIWGAVGIAATALVAWLLFAEPLTPRMVVGLGLIVCGVVLVEVGSRPIDEGGADRKSVV